MKNILLVSINSFFDTPGEIPFLFKKAGKNVNVEVLCPKNSWLLSNRFHDKWIEVPEDAELIKLKLLQLVKDNPNYYFWIILLDDETVKLMNDGIESEELFKKIMPINKIDNREVLSSKAGLSNLCATHHIATPQFINYSQQDNIDSIINTLQFPILLKEDFSFSGLGIQYCEEPSMLASCLNKVNNTSNLVLQEFIKGKDIGLEALFRNGELVMYNCAEILSYMYNQFSFTTRRLYYQDKNIEEHLHILGKSLGLNGFASIQYIYHPERKIYYLIEVDARVNLWMAYSRFTANNFSEGIKRIVEEKNIEPIVFTDKKYEVAIFDRDIRRCIKHKDIKGFMRWIFNYRGYWKFIPLHDLKLFKRIFKKLLKDLFHKFLK